MKHTLHESTLENGIKLLIINTPGTNIFDMAVAVNAGYRFTTIDPKFESSETPHILEHSMFDGSRGYPSTDVLQSVFTTSGGEWNGTTTPYHVMLTFSNKAKNAAKIIDSALDMLYFPKLTQQSFDEEIQVVYNELDDKIGDFVYNAAQHTSQQILPNACYRTDESINSLNFASPAETRKYHKKYFTTANTTIVIACDTKAISEAAVTKAIVRASKDAPAGTRHELPKLDIYREPNRTCQFEKISRSIKTVSLSLSYSHPAKFVNADESDTLGLKATLFTQMVSGMKSYSVQHQLRKLGLAYGIDFAPIRSLETAGFELSLESPRDKFPELLAQTLVLTHKLAQKGITDQQFTDLKEELLESFDDQIETAHDAMGWYLEDYLTEGTLRTPTQLKKLAKPITQEDVLAYARSTLTPENQYATVFAARALRTSVAVDDITTAGLMGNYPTTFKTTFTNELDKYYQEDENAGWYRRVEIYINKRPWLAWSRTILELTIGLALLYFASDDGNWWHYVLAAILIVDALVDTTVRLWRQSK